MVSVKLRFTLIRRVLQAFFTDTLQLSCTHNVISFSTILFQMHNFALIPSKTLTRERY